MKYISRKRTNGETVEITQGRPARHTTKPLAAHNARCGHCRTATTHEIRYCGQYRVCAVCSSCGMHRRIGDRIPHLDVLQMEE